MPCMELFELQSKFYKNKILEETNLKYPLKLDQAIVGKNM